MVTASLMDVKAEAPVGGRAHVGHWGDEMTCRAAEIAAILAASPCLRAVLHIAKSMSACSMIDRKHVRTQRQGLPV